MMLAWVLVAPLPSWGQGSRPWEALFADLSTLDDMESAEWAETYELLCDLEQAPMDINTATREDLLRLPFLSEQQVEDIHVYLYRYGSMKTLGELAMIESIDYTTRCLLTYFTCCRDREAPSAWTWDKVMRYGRHDVLATAHVPFYKTRGDDHGYLGYPYRHSLRYRFQYGDHLKVGLMGAQDAGEPFFADRNGMGYDYYSFYAEAHRIGRVQTLVAGRYRASFGMGLVMGGATGVGKLSALTALGSRGAGLRAHTSRSESRYLQGAGATVRLAKGLDLSAFASYRKMDATLRGDTAIATIVDDGYHRTATEMNKKFNSSQTSAGANIGYRYRGWHAGTTAVYTAYDKPLSPDTTQSYRRYYPTGRRFWNASADYGHTGPLVSFHGEVATSGVGAWAMLHSVSLTPSSGLSVMALHRFYSKRYHSPHAVGFSEGGRVQGESGLSVGTQWRATRQLSLTAYSDYAYFPGATYQARVSSHAWDNMLQAQYTAGNLSLTARYRLKWREEDNSGHTALTSRLTHRARLTAGLGAGPWRVATTADIAHSSKEKGSTGWMLSANGGYSHQWLRVAATAGYFRTDDADSRIYGYEQGVLYAFAYRSYTGEGLRYALSARADIGQQLTFIAYLSTTNYFDRDHISTSLQRIDHSSKTDLELQLRWRF